MKRYLELKNSFSGKFEYSSEEQKFYFNKKELASIGQDIPSFIDTDFDALTREVSDFYNNIKFPNYKNMEDYASIYDKGRGNIFTRKLDDELGWNCKVLELGCGSGQMSLFLGRGKREVYAVDISPGSLLLGEEFRKHSDISKVYFMHMDVFNLCFKDDLFDFVVSNGVLHHTKNAKKAFKCLVDVTKPGGFIVVGLYHRYGRFFTKIKQYLAKLIGNKIFYFDKTSRNMGSSEKREAWVKDQFFNPHETVHTPREVMSWFDENDVEFINLIPHFDITTKPLFYKRNKQTLSFLDDLILMFDHNQIREGGFFIMVGKKNGG